MSAPEDKDKTDLNLSLPVKPVQSLASRLSSAPTPTPTLPSRPAFALPPRPTGAPPSSSYLASHLTRGIRNSSLSPPLGRERDDSYRPSYARSRDDVYLPTPSPPPRFRDFDDRYIPSPSPPYQRHRSPTPRYRSLTPPRLRSLTPARRKSRTPSRRRSLTPPHRPVSRSPVKRLRSPSPTSSSRRSLSLTPATRTTFYTRSHLREKEQETKRQKREERDEAREKARKEKEIQWAAYRKRTSQPHHPPDQS